MQNHFDLLVADVMPIYMIMPRYSHNYALFYQLLDSNLFTHHNTYAILREATSETYGPRVYFPSYKFPIYFILQSLLFNLYNKNTKNIYLIIFIRSHFCKWPWRYWQPFVALVARFLIVCAGTRDLRVVSYWIDTLVLKNWGKYLRYFTASSSPLRGNPTQCSRGSNEL